MTFVPQRAFQAHNATDIKVYERPLFERLKEEVDGKIYHYSSVKIVIIYSS